MSFHAGFPQIDFRAALNDDQYAAVTAEDGPALVLAGAGSGKTRTLTYRVAYLLSQGVRPWEILLLTFTNKAAKEMLYRVEDLTGITRSDFWGGTFHSIGQRILRANAEAAGIQKNFTIMDADESDTLFAQIAKDTNPALFKTGKPSKSGKDNKESGFGMKPRVVLDALSFARNTRRPPQEVFIERFPWARDAAETALPAIAEAYQKSKREQSLCDYDDLLELWLELLLKEQAVREHYQDRFRHILVDEFQDTNKLQSDIVDTLAGHHQLMAVGDDAQCIYTWRGAEFANVADFTTRHPGAAIHKIEINYRSTPEILTLANGILDSQTDGSGLSKTLRPSRPSGEKPRYIPVLDASEQAIFVTRRVRDMHFEGRSLGEIIVLYRAHYQAMELQMELTRQGIPFTITSGVRFFEQAHIRDMTAHLRLIHNPADTVAFTRLMALLPRVGPRTATRILELAESESRKTRVSLIAALAGESILAKVPEESREDFHDLALTLLNMQEALDGPSPAPTSAEKPDSQFDLFSAPQADAGKTAAAIEDTGTAPEPAEPSRQATPAEIVRIGIEGWYGDFMRNLYTDWENRREDLKALVNFAEKYTDMGEMLSQLVLQTTETSNKSSEPDNDTLRLTTVHQAKGLEFPVVFVLGCSEGLFPLKRAIDKGDISEERRLFYVAVTRAMDELYLISPRLQRGYEGVSLLEVSQFINDLSPSSYEMINIPRMRG
jgi:DNA helicase-2/ATP-dependent DNA helicase PcrA